MMAELSAAYAPGPASSRFSNALFRAISWKFPSTLRPALSRPFQPSPRSFPTQNRRQRWRPRSEDFRRVTRPEILGFNCAPDISGEGRAEGINGPNPRRSCSATCWCNAYTRTTGRMFNWAFGRARPNANVSHNPACQLTLLETSSAHQHAPDRQRSTINPIIDCGSARVRRPITKSRRTACDYLARANLY